MKLTLKAKKRDLLGKKVSSLREAGLIPAELYGKGLNNEHLSVDAREFAAVYKEAGESTMIDLDVEGKKSPVLIHDVQQHFLKDKVNSVDFYKPRLDELVKVSVPLKFVGEAPAVKEADGVFVASMEELEIEALPTALPQMIEVDISQIKEIGDHISVKDLSLPEGVKAVVDKETAIASVTEKMSEEEDAAMSAEADLDSIEAEAEKDTQEEEGEEGGEKEEEKGGEKEPQEE